jgi:hypothetical protein
MEALQSYHEVLFYYSFKMLDLYGITFNNEKSLRKKRRCSNKQSLGAISMSEQLNTLRIDETCPKGDIDGFVVAKAVDDPPCHAIVTDLKGVSPRKERQLQNWRTLASDTFNKSGERVYMEVNPARMTARLCVRVPPNLTDEELAAYMERFIQTLRSAGVLQNPFPTVLH